MKSRLGLRQDVQALPGLHAWLSPLRRAWPAVGSGWANACILQERLAPGHSVLGGEQPSPAASSLPTGHLESGIDDGDNPGAEQRICLEVCDDGMHPVVKSSSDFEWPRAVMAPPMALSWPTLPAAGATSFVRLALPAPGPGVLLRKRFSRLAS